jgi:hypothetical protein
VMLSLRCEHDDAFTLVLQAINARQRDVDVACTTNQHITPRFIDGLYASTEHKSRDRSQITDLFVLQE